MKTTLLWWKNRIKIILQLLIYRFFINFRQTGEDNYSSIICFIIFFFFSYGQVQRQHVKTIIEISKYIIEKEISYWLCFVYIQSFDMFIEVLITSLELVSLKVKSLYPNPFFYYLQYWGDFPSSSVLLYVRHYFHCAHKLKYLEFYVMIHQVLFPTLIKFRD